MTDEALAVSPRDDRGLDRRADRLPSDLLASALWLSLYVALGSFVLAITAGVGPHPGRRLAIGLLLVGISGVALRRRESLGAALRARPWLVMPLAAVQLAAAAADGVLPGPYVVISMTSIGLAVIVARTRTVWLTVALLEVGFIIAVVVERSPTASGSRDLAGVVGQLLGFPFAALVVLGLARMFTRFLADLEPTLDAIRDGAPACTPALTMAISRAGRTPVALLESPAQQVPVPRPLLTRLTPTEVAVIQALAEGLAPKEIAHQRGVSLNTVRTHIKNAKRKTGARTPRELAAMIARDGAPLNQRGT
jgi:DNA-binding CsgD family transcriptional regulator